MSKRLNLRKIRNPNTSGAFQLGINKPKIETDSKQIANGYQTDSKQIANGYQTDSNEHKAKVQTDSKQVAKRIAKQIAIGEQTDSKQVANLAFESLVGNEKNLLFLIFKECLRTGNLITPPLTLNFITESLECSSGTAKSTIYRLVKKEVIWRYESKTGRGGWIKFKLPKDLYQNLRIRGTDSKQIANGYQTDSKQVAKRVAEQIAKAPSSSSINYITTTTRLDESLGIRVPENLKELGFGISHVNRILESKDTSLTTQELQDSLDAFSYDLKHGHVKPKTSPLNFLMGILLKRGSYTSEQSLVELKKEIDAYLSRINELEVSRVDLEKIEKQKQFEKWLETLSDEIKNEIVPPNNLIKSGSPFQLTMLKGHWEKEVIGKIDANNNQ